MGDPITADDNMTVAGRSAVTWEYGIRHRSTGRIHREGLTKEEAATFMDPAEWEGLDATGLFEPIRRRVSDWETIEGGPALDSEYRLFDAESALAELVRLKDGPRDAGYREQKELAWSRARDVLMQINNDSPPPPTRPDDQGSTK